MASNGYRDRVAAAAAMIRGARHLLAFTGAGISTESGLSDFRSPGGVWTRHRMVTYQEFTASREARGEFWRMKRAFQRELVGARPNPAHLALAELERLGRLAAIVTQNIDGLHQEAGSSPGRVIELHGTGRRWTCISCGRQGPIGEVQARLDAGQDDPRCEACQGLVMPAIVMFGQSMPVTELERAFGHAAEADVVLMIGSSLTVEPAASVPREAARSGARLIFVNRTETPLDHLAALIFREPAGGVLADIVAGLDAAG